MKSNKYNDLERNSNVWIDDWFLLYFAIASKKCRPNEHWKGKKLLFEPSKMNIKILLHQILRDSACKSAKS